MKRLLFFIPHFETHIFLKMNDINEILTITPYGAGSEVGRSCILLEYQGMRVLLDCGVHPGYI